jgi:hypothetical protein
MATLLTNANLRLAWYWQDATGLSETTNQAKLAFNDVIADVSVANLVWQDTRTLAAQTIEMLDLSSLPISALGVSGTLSLSKVHQIFIRNNLTQEDLSIHGEIEATLRVGLPNNQTAGHYAMAVGFDSHSYLYSREGWLVAEPLGIANAADIAIPYDIVLVGQGAIVNA